MGQTIQADIADNEKLFIWDTASAATNVGSTKVMLFEAPCKLVITEVAWIPTGGNQPGNTTSSRALYVVDGSSDGSGTVQAASLALTSTRASNTPADMTVTAANATLDDGDICVFSRSATAGGAASHTGLKAGMLNVRYREL